MLSHYKQKLAEALSQERSLSQEAISLVLMVIHDVFNLNNGGLTRFRLCKNFSE